MKTIVVLTAIAKQGRPGLEALVLSKAGGGLYPSILRSPEQPPTEGSHQRLVLLVEGVSVVTALALQPHQDSGRIRSKKECLNS